MKGKPIEPGCKALVVNALHPPSNSGKVVTVLHLAPEGYLPPPFRGDGITKPSLPNERSGPLWVVHREQGDLLVMAVGLAGGIVKPTDERVFPQSMLIRLDDPEFTENEHEQLETHR